MTNGLEGRRYALFGFEGTLKRKSSDHSGEDTPVPISNTVVKLLSADGTWREAARENRTSLVYEEHTQSRVLFLLLETDLFDGASVLWYSLRKQETDGM